MLRPHQHSRSRGSRCRFLLHSLRIRLFSPCRRWPLSSLQRRCETFAVRPRLKSDNSLESGTAGNNPDHTPRRPLLKMSGWPSSSILIWGIFGVVVSVVMSRSPARGLWHLGGGPRPASSPSSFPSPLRRPPEDHRRRPRPRGRGRGSSGSGGCGFSSGSSSSSPVPPSISDRHRSRERQRPT